MNLNIFFDNSFFKAIKYIYKGSVELIKEYLVIDFISDSLIHLALEVYLSFFITHSHSGSGCCGPKKDSGTSLSSQFCSPIKSWDQIFYQQTIKYFKLAGIHVKKGDPIANILVKGLKFLKLVEKTSSSYLSAIPFGDKIFDIFHFHGKTKLIGLATAPVVYTLNYNRYLILNKKNYIEKFAKKFLEFGSYIGINPYESIFAFDSLVSKDNKIALNAKNFASNEIDARHNDRGYKIFMNVTETWMESVVDAYEHGTEYFYMGKNLFQSPNHIFWKLFTVTPLVISGYLLNKNTQSKEHFIEHLYDCCEKLELEREVNKTIESFSQSYETVKIPVRDILFNSTDEVCPIGEDAFLQAVGAQT
jgi:hypothetical protein